MGPKNRTIGGLPVKRQDKEVLGYFPQIHYRDKDEFFLGNIILTTILSILLNLTI